MCSSDLYNMAYDYAEWEMQDLPGFFALQEAWLLDCGWPLGKTGTVIELWINNPIALVNGASVMIDPQDQLVTPIIHRSRTMLPLRFIAEALDIDVAWDGTEKKVTLVKG